MRVFKRNVKSLDAGLWQTSQQIGGVAANFFAASTLQRSGWRAIFFQALTVGVFLFSFLLREKEMLCVRLFFARAHGA